MGHTVTMPVMQNATFRWVSVTEELRAAEQPLRQWFSAQLPHARSVYRDFAETVPPDCVQPPVGVDAHTLGAAFEYCLAAGADSCAEMELVIDGAVWVGGITGGRGWPDTARELVVDLHQQAADSATVPSARARLVRGCWAAALLTEISRGVPFERSALTALSAAPTVDGLLELMPAQAEHDIDVLLERSRRILLPFITSRAAGKVVYGPTFNSPLPGDADLIAGRSLIEIKAVIGRRRRDGTPRWGMDARTLYQMLTYGLLAQTQWAIDELVVFNPRYAHLQVWRLDALLAQMAGGPVCAVTLGSRLREFLENPFGPCIPDAARRAAMALSECREDNAGRVRSATARGIAAQRRSDGDDDHRWRYPGPRWPLYSALLESAATSESRSALAKLVGQATACKASTVRSWQARGVPEDRVNQVRRAAAVWQLGGIEAAAKVFGLTPRRTAAWMAGRGRQHGDELARIEAATCAVGGVVSLRVRISRVRLAGACAPRRRPRQVAGWTLQLGAETVQRLHWLITGVFANIDAVLEILSGPLLEQHSVEIPCIRFADILVPDDGDTQYALTPEGVRGPGYPPC